MEQETRKIIKFGKNSFVVTLPSKWVKENKLEKGSSIYMQHYDEDIILRAKEEKQEEKKENITINVNNKTKNDVMRIVVNTYLNNIKTVELLTEDEKIQKNIKETVLRLSAMEIIEQNKKKIVLKDYLDINEVNIENTIRKNDYLNRVSFDEEFKNKESFKEYDIQADRLYFLLKRALIIYTENKILREKNDLTILNITNLFKLIEHLRSINRYIRKIKKVSADSEKDILLKGIKKFYTDVMEAYYKKDEQQALKKGSQRKELVKRLEEAIESADKINTLKGLFTSIELVETIQKIGRLLY